MPKTIPSDLLRPTDSILLQGVRYGFVGFIAFVIDFTLLVFLTEVAGLHYLVSACGGFLGGLVTNYLLSIYWVFSNRTVENRKTEFSVFALVGLGGLLVTEVALWTGTEMARLDYRVSKLIAVAIVLCWNFGLRKSLLFRNARPT